MDGILSTTATAGKIVFVDCNGILVPTLKKPQPIDRNVLMRMYSRFPDIVDFLSKVRSADLAKLSFKKLYSEPLPALDEFGRVKSFIENEGFTFNSSSMESDPSFVEISLDDSFAEEEKDISVVHSNDVSSATVAHALGEGIRTVGNKVRGFFARKFPKQL